MGRLAGASALTFAEVCEILVREPFCMSLAEIADLDPYQVHHIFFRDKSKRLDRAGAASGAAAPMTPATYEQLFRRTWKARGYADADVDAKWQTYVAEQTALAKNPSKPS